MKYLLDSNTYIQAKNSYYQMDVCPGYWDWIDDQFDVDVLYSVSMVYDELKSFGDELSQWVQTRKAQFLEISDNKTQDNFKDIANHVSQAGKYSQNEIANFLGGADPWLIAKAITLEDEEMIIVTQEKRVDRSSKKIKIPNICEDFGIKYINIFDLLQTLEACFILNRP